MPTLATGRWALLTRSPIVVSSAPLQPLRGSSDELAGAAAVGMTVVRTTEHQDTDPSWDGPAISSLGALPALLRNP